MKYIVVVGNMSGPVEVLARALAEATGRTPYEMRMRASVPHGGPTIIGTYGTLEMATKVADRLRTANLTVWVNTPQAFVKRWRYRVARYIELSDSITIEDRGGVRTTIPTTRVMAVISGMGHWTETHLETKTTRKLNVKRAMVGLVSFSKVTTTHQKTTKGGNRFLAIYTGSDCVLFKEEELLYDRLGSLMQPSRTANFMVIKREIERRLSHAKFDDRLLTRAGQTQILGGSVFTPEEDGDLAAALVVQSLIE